MINALCYEPQDQHQRFEPRSQQHGERQEQDRHIHLHFHLHLTFRASQGRSAFVDAAWRDPVHEGVPCPSSFYCSLAWAGESRGACSEPASPTHRKLGFVAVAGMVLLLLGGLLFNISILLSGGIAPLIIFLPATCMAVIVAICTLLASHKSTQARPKDASASDVDSPEEPRGYRG